MCVEDFGGPATDNPAYVSHPVRLLTVFKGVQGTNEQLTCLSIHLDPVSRVLVVSSKERLLPSGMSYILNKTKTLHRLVNSEAGSICLQNYWLLSLLHLYESHTRCDQ